MTPFAASTEEWNRRLYPDESAEFAKRLELDGIVGPFRICDEARALDLAGKFLEVGNTLDTRMANSSMPADRQAAMKQAILGTRNRHLYDPAVMSLLEQPSLTSRLAICLGNDLVFWRTQAFVLHALRDQGAVAPLPWHRDNYLTLLDLPRTNISVHLALTHSTEVNCMRALIGSHRLSDQALSSGYGLNHIEGSEDSGPGTSRYEGDVMVNEPALRHLVMAPGEAYLFNDRLVHASSWTANPGKDSVRVAFAIRATTPAVRILPAAFQDSLPREDHPITLSAG